MLQSPFKIPIYFTSFLLILIFSFCWIVYEANPFQILKYLFAQVTSGVGLSVQVPENPINTWAKQLKQKEIDLQKREEILIQREAQSRIIYILILTLITILFFLIFLNFYFDFRARHKLKKA